MFSVIRKRFSYVNVAMTLALVFAMTGGAYASSKYLITSTKQIKPSVLKSLKGANGKPGLNGVQGPAGPAGAQGTAGANGKDGTNGSTGANGKSVVAGVEAKGANCKEGGSNFEVEGSGIKSYACNGEKGKNGTFEGQALPSGKTLTGAYAAASFAEAEIPNAGFGVVQTGVSFALPVSPEIQPGNVEEVGPEEGAGEAHENLPEVGGKKVCMGNNKEPGAAEGYLCVFVSEADNLVSATPEVFVRGTFGFAVSDYSAAKGAMTMAGSWAVTAG